MALDWCLERALEMIHKGQILHEVAESSQAMPLLGNVEHINTNSRPILLAYQPLRGVGG